MLRRRKAGHAALIALILFFALSLSIAPVTASSAAAQSTAPVIDTAQLRLWPEYDDPGLLVIFAGQFGTSTTFPLQAVIPAPAGARNVQATYKDPSGSLINRPFEIKDGQLTYELPAAGFQVEYYVDRAPSGDQRTITYSFVAPYAINALQVEVQQPARSASFTLTPASESSQKAPDGLTYYTFNKRSLAAGEKLDITVSYSKTDTGLSAPQLVVGATDAAAQASAAAPAPAGATANALPWILIGVGLLLLAGILVYWLWRQRREPAPAVARVKRTTVQPGMSTRPTRPPAAMRRSGEPGVFCTNCGQPLAADDNFCSQCGAPRRS